MIIVWKLDRFARNRYDSARYKAALKKNGVKVVSATEVISDGAEGIILESVLEGYAEYYLSLIHILYTLESKNRTEACPFYQRLGYSEEEANVIYFDRDTLLKNEKVILYLFGQVSAVHTGKAKNEAQTIADFMIAYSGNNWTNNRGRLLELLYLGANRETAILYPFNKEKGDITRITPEVTPTLSPKDPAFPAWWEAHKGEWEDKA